jgi:hypothetical protein
LGTVFIELIGMDVLLKAIDEVANFFGKSKKEVTEKEAKQLVNKDSKK